MRKYNSIRNLINIIIIIIIIIYFSYEKIQFNP